MATTGCIACGAGDPSRVEPGGGAGPAEADPVGGAAEGVNPAGGEGPCPGWQGRTQGVGHPNFPAPMKWNSPSSRTGVGFRAGSQGPEHCGHAQPYGSLDPPLPARSQFKVFSFPFLARVFVTYIF